MRESERQRTKRKVKVEVARIRREKVMEDNQRADRAEVKENSRKDRVTAQKREKKAEKKAQEQAEAVETKSTALQISTMEIMSQLLTLQSDAAKLTTDFQEQMEEKEAQEKLIRQKQAEDQINRGTEPKDEGTRNRKREKERTRRDT